MVHQLKSIRKYRYNNQINPELIQNKSRINPVHGFMHSKYINSIIDQPLNNCESLTHPDSNQRIFVSHMQDLEMKASKT